MKMRAESSPHSSPVDKVGITALLPGFIRRQLYPTNGIFASAMPDHSTKLYLMIDRYTAVIKQAICRFSECVMAELANVKLI